MKKRHVCDRMLDKIASDLPSHSMHGCTGVVQSIHRYAEYTHLFFVSIKFTHL